MMGLFDKTFFKFALGFAIILGISFTVLFIAGYYDEHVRATAAVEKVPVR